MIWQFDDLQRPAKELQQTACRLTLLAVFAFAGSSMAAAQQTVYVGGSGKFPVEVNVEVVNQLATRPGLRPLLDPPGQAPRSTFLLGSASVSAVTTLTPLLMPEPKPETTAAVIPSLSPPLPEPVPAVEPAPLVPVDSEPLPAEAVPEPEPEPVATLVPAPEPEPAPVATPVPEPEPTVAALTPAMTPTGEILSIPFVSGLAELPDSAESNLQAVAASLAANDSLRAQLKAYADGTTGSASSARRLSLSRALAVRSVLIELGVRSTRIDVRALGDRYEGGAPDRVDVLVTNR